MVVEVGDLASLAGDQESDLLVDVAFAEPVLSDPRGLASSFLRLHAALETSVTRLERDQRLTEWLRALIERCSTQRPSRSPLSHPATTGHSVWPATTSATGPSATSASRNSPLKPASASSASSDCSASGSVLPPHALQVAHRIRAARRLLEAGETIAETAATTGFADQSHLHRHFQRSLGLTPARYQQRFRR